MVIGLLPASMLLTVTDGPPVIWNPVVFNTEVPAEKELPVNVLPLTAPDVPSKVIRLVPEPTFTVLLQLQNLM